MKNLSHILRSGSGIHPERKFLAIPDLPFAKHIGDPLLKKLDYKIM